MYKIRKITVVILVIAMVLLCMNIMAQHSFASRKLSKAQIKRLEFMVQTIGSQMNQYSSIIVEKYDENRELDIDFYRSTLFFYLFENDGIGKRLGKNIVVPKRLDDDTVCEEFDVFFAITKKQAEKIFVSFYGPKYKSKIDKILSVYTCKNGYYYFGIGDGGFKWATITKYSVDKEGIVTAKVEVKGNETGYKEDDFLIGTFETIFVPNKTSMFGYYIRSFKAEMKS